MKGEAMVRCREKEGRGYAWPKKEVKVQAFHGTASKVELREKKTTPISLLIDPPSQEFALPFFVHFAMRRKSDNEKVLYVTGHLEGKAFEWYY